MASSVDPDETARREPSHLDINCLLRYLVCSTDLNGLILVAMFQHLATYSVREINAIRGTCN